MGYHGRCKIGEFRLEFPNKQRLLNHLKTKFLDIKDLDKKLSTNNFRHD